VSDHRENIPQTVAFLASAVIDDDDGTLGNIVDEIANRAGRNRGRTIQNRERAATQSKSGIERFDAETLTAIPSRSSASLSAVVSSLDARFTFVSIRQLTL
jgi:hypothetical protein